MKSKFVYSPEYYASIGDHVFKVEKYEGLYERLVKEKHIPVDSFLKPRLLAREEILLVHTSGYYADFTSGSHTPRTYLSELPLTSEIVSGFSLNSGGTVVAGEWAFSKGAALNIGGGFHHAFPDHAEGFCYLNDVAILCEKLLNDKKVFRILIVDLDLHQGNGTAFIFRGDDRVFTFSMHQEQLYPVKQKSHLDIGLDRFTGDDTYLEFLKVNLLKILDEFKPEMVCYLAGADPYEEDQLGDLKLTLKGLDKRDRMVFGYCRERNLPVCTVLAGGYARNLSDTVQIHFQTACAMMDFYPYDDSRV